MDFLHDAQQLAEMQALPLNQKIQITQARIIEWYQHYNGNVCVSFSGGKDSTVLLHLVRQIFPDVKAVFSNTGLEYPEIVKFAHSFENVDVVTPEMRFDEVISTYGYPLISKEVSEAIYYARRIREDKNVTNTEDSPKKKAPKWGDYHRRCLNPDKSNPDDKKRFWKDVVASGDFGKSQFNKSRYLPLVSLPIPISQMCCHKMKKQPLKSYQHNSGRYPFIGTLAEESRIRKQGWLRHGCNAFDSKNPTSQPLSFWTEQDILLYIVQNNIEIANIYGDIVVEDKHGNQYPVSDMFYEFGRLKCTGCQGTGCIFCALGFHNERGETRFQRLARTHPKQYEYALGGGQWVDNPAYDPTAPRYDGVWENWNPPQIWIPSKQGIGLRYVFNMVNEVYGKDFYRYE